MITEYKGKIVKCILAIFSGAMFLYFEGTGLNSICFILLFIIVYAICGMVRDCLAARIVIDSIYVILALLAFIYPQVALLMPIAAIAVAERKWYISGVLAGLSVLISLIYYHDVQRLFAVMLFALAYGQVLVINENRDSRLAVLEARDYSKEYELLLEEKNRKLIESQDKTVYAATLSERNRIAREIHDNVGHMLTRAILQMGAIKVLNKDEKLKPSIEEIDRTLNTAMSNIRNSVHDLHDESIDLESSINEILQSAKGFHTRLDYDGNDSFPRSVKYAFIGIVKEAVNNSIKHSNGDSIEVIVRKHPGFYQLRISDNGTNSKIDYSSGIGISNMEERTKQIGGYIKLDNEKGFAIMVTVLRSERDVEE